ncbi:hypothetical protein [Cryobacterium sp. Y62]|uniref:hypothetical protein n=1 Tax=Cryobacterium sp. Y62 TaxID=2048284 RepID=UPI000CE34D56|nr:hypothetical protein [Cryobacterium sp. Y62]
MTDQENRDTYYEAYRQPGQNLRSAHDAGLAAVVAAAKAKALGDLTEEFSVDHEPMPGLKYVTTNIMLAETMVAGKPGAKLLRRMAPAWLDLRAEMKRGKS